MPSARMLCEMSTTVSSFALAKLLPDAVQDLCQCRSWDMSVGSLLRCSARASPPGDLCGVFQSGARLACFLKTSEGFGSRPRF